MQRMIWCLYPKLLILAASLCLTTLSYGQLSTTGFASARSIGLGSSGVAHVSATGLFENQAAAAWSESHSVMAGAQRLFGLSDLNSIGAFAQINSGLGQFGLELNQFGSSDYKEQKIGLMYSRKLSNRIALAVQLNFLQLSISENGTASAFSFEIAALSKITKDLNVGVHIYSPMPIEISDEVEIPSIFTVGAEYTISEDLKVSAEVRKDIDYDIRFHMGVAYQIIEILELRIGTATTPASFTFGAGVEITEGFHIDIASAWDARLGFSPAITARYILN